MTDRQRRLYFSLWGKVRRIYRKRGYSPTEADGVRMEIHQRELGETKSSKDLNNADLDKILAAFKAELPSADLITQLEATEQPRKRAIWKIEHLGLTPRYIEKVSQSRFGTRDWRRLPEPDLEKLRITMIERARAFAKGNGEPKPAATQVEIPF